MRRLVPIASLAVLLTLVAPVVAAPVPSPAVVLVEVSSTAPIADLAAMGKTLTALYADAKPPTEAAVLAALQGTLGMKSLEGVDLAKPVHLVWLDPKRFAKPFVLIADVKNATAFKRALLDSPAVAQRTRKNRVVLGDEAALAQVGEWGLGLKSAGSGIRAVAHLDRIWALFGEQARAMAPIMTAAAASGKAANQALLSSMIDGLVSAAEQSSALVAELRFAHARADLTLTLETKPGSTMASYFEAARPSDFSLVSKLAAQPGLSFVAAGDLDPRTARWFLGLSTMGSTPTEQEKRDLDTLVDLGTGQMAAAGEIGVMPSMSMQYLTGTRDYRRQLEVYPRIQQAMMRSRMQSASSTKTTLGATKTTREDGLDISTQAINVDVGALAGQAGKPPIQSSSSWTGWEGLVATTVGPSSVTTLRQLVASARKGSETLVLGAAMSASVAEARAAKDSGWLAVDVANVMRATAKEGQTPLNLLMFVGLGYGEKSARLRLTAVAK